MSTPRQFEVCAVGDGLAIFWSQINSAGFGLEPLVEQTGAFCITPRKGSIQNQLWS